MTENVNSASAGSIAATGCSAGMKNLATIIERIAPSDLNVLIVGENGTGKEWTARTIHQLSHRATHRFFSIDCTTLPTDKLAEEIFGCEVATSTGIEVRQGALEQADGGTIFFDEIGELPLAIQKQIARMFGNQLFRRVGAQESTCCNVRVIAALNRRFKGRIEGSFFPKEIHHYISPIILNLPPLRERREDIPYLIEKFLLQSNSPHSRSTTVMSPEALRLCVTYDWPGNIRQLKNALEYAIAVCQNHHIQVEHLPLFIHDIKSDRASRVHSTLMPSPSQPAQGSPRDLAMEQNEKGKGSN
jgi:two-component system response regulator HydG